MKNFFIMILSLMLTVSMSARQYNIIPQPKEITDCEGQFLLQRGMKVYAQGEANRKVATFFINKLNASAGLDLSLTDRKGAAQIRLLTSTKIKGKEAYRLSVSPKAGVVVEAATDCGIFYAMQTLMQLLPPEVESPTLCPMFQGQAPQLAIPAVVVNDEPRFPYRGFMLDVCRHFFTIDEIKKHIDILSMYKANNLHLHLTEDQGWRVEIKKYPRLTEVGATAIGRNDTGRGELGSQRYFYTQDELKELVAYARERFINIIPEFEMPGHEMAAIAAYPWLSCRGEEIQPSNTWGVKSIIMCPGKESTFQFLQDVIDEMVQIFPSTYFNIGGDEAPRTEWKKCPLCQKRADELGFKDEQGRSRESQLQSYIVTRMEKYLNRYGKTIIGWDEILEGGGLNPTAVVMSWRGTKGAIEAARAGHHAIMAPSSDGYYLDYYEGDRALEPVAPTYAGSVPLDMTYGFEPIVPELEGENEQYVLGTQGNLWAEYITDDALMEYRFYPRILAIMETGWTPRHKKDFTDFSRRIDNDAYLRLQAHKANFYIPMPEQPEGSCDYIAFTDQATLTFKTHRPLPMHYTTDGSEPTPGSTLYTQPLHFTTNTTLKIATFLPSGLKSPTRTIHVQKQSLSPAVGSEEAPLPPKGEERSEVSGYSLEKPSPETNSQSSSLKSQFSILNGLLIRSVDGTFTSVPQLHTVIDWQQDTIPSLEKINHLKSDGSPYAAIAEGMVSVPQDGVWYFRSNYSEVWIDGQKVVDNTAHWVLDGERGGRSMALQAGLHHIKVVFLGYLAGGRPYYWNNGSIRWRLQEASKYEKITPDKLFFRQ